MGRISNWFNKIVDWFNEDYYILTHKYSGEWIRLCVPYDVNKKEIEICLIAQGVWDEEGFLE